MHHVYRVRKQPAPVSSPVWEAVQALAIHSSPDLQFIPIVPEHTTHSVLIWKKNRLFSPAVSLFIQEINMLRSKME